MLIIVIYFCGFLTKGWRACGLFLVSFTGYSFFNGHYLSTYCQL